MIKVKKPEIDAQGPVLRKKISLFVNDEGISTDTLVRLKKEIGKGRVRSHIEIIKAQTESLKIYEPR